MDIPEVFDRDDGRLRIEGLSAHELSEVYGTPLYVYSESRIRDNYRRLQKALTDRYDKIRIHFAAKSNTNISILRILKDEGAHLDTVSVGEVSLSLKAGFEPQQILFTGTNMSDEELDYLIDSGVMINVDSLSVLDRLLDKDTPKMLSFRVNPEIGAGAHEHLITAGEDSKFGILESDIVEAYEKALDAGVERFGIHMHIGSGMLDPEPHRTATHKLMDISGRISEKAGIEFEFFDIGGGIGVPYEPGESKMDLDEFSEDVIGTFKEKLDEHDLGDPYLCMEPGRYLVCDAGIVLTRVNTMKDTINKRMVGVDAGLHTLIRPAMYGAYHHILHARKTGEVNKTYDVMGPLCESSDFLGEDRELPAVKEGDLLAVLNAGAYGFSMSSNYNSMPKPAEVLVNDDEHTLIRESEDLDDLVERQKVAGWLE